MFISYHSAVPHGTELRISGWDLNWNVTYMKGWAAFYPNAAQVRPGSAKLSDPTVAQWFDTSLWNDPASRRVVEEPFTLRTFPLRFSDVRLPGYQNWDVSISKYFPIHEQVRMQFRFEAVNAFNHPWFTGLASGRGQRSIRAFESGARQPPALPSSDWNCSGSLVDRRFLDQAIVFDSRVSYARPNSPCSSRRTRPILSDSRRPPLGAPLRAPPKRGRAGRPPLPIWDSCEEGRIRRATQLLRSTGTVNVMSRSSPFASISCSQHATVYHHLERHLARVADARPFHIPVRLLIVRPADFLIWPRIKIRADLA